MQRCIKLAFLVLSITLFVQCKNDVNILAPYKDVPVIYGLLDQNDTTHYIRVNKAFEGSGNAYTMAQQYDSVNYPAGTISVQLLNINTNTTITLSSTTSIPLDTGIFSYPTQVIYYTKSTIDPNAQYKLIVTNEKTGKVCTGSTKLLPDVAFTQPNDYLTPSTISFSTLSNFPNTVTWQADSQAVIYQLTLRFFYKEIDTVKKDTVHDYADWIFAPQTTSLNQGGLTLSESYSGPAFVQFLLGTLKPVGNATVKRVPVNVQVIFTSGSLDFYTYIQLSQPSLTVNQQKPFFSDVTNGVGIFASRHVQTALKPLSISTINLLDTARSLKPLNFKEL